VAFCPIKLMSTRSIKMFKRSHEGGTKSDYFICSISGALFVYISQTYTPHKIAFSISVLDPISLVFLILSFFAGLKRIETVNCGARLNHRILDAAEKAGNITEQLASNTPGPFYNQEGGEISSRSDLEALRSQYLKTISDIKALLPGVDRKGARFYKARDFFLLLGFVSIFLSKVLQPYESNPFLHQTIRMNQSIAPPVNVPVPRSTFFTRRQGTTIFLSCGEDYIAKITDDGASIFADGLSHPQGMAEDSSGDLFVANCYADTILEFPVIKGGLSNKPVVFASGLHRPSDLAFDHLGNLFEADSASGAINKFIYSGGELSNTPIPVITDLNGNENPCGLCFDTQENLYVAISIGGIIKFAHTNSGLAATPTIFAKFSRARQMAFDKKGNLFTADHVDQRVYEFINSSEGLSNEPTVFAEKGSLFAPIGVAFDSTGNLFVTNWGYGGGTNALEFPNVDGVLSGNSIVFATDFKAPNYMFIYSASGSKR
jgi:hypothetical protein